MKGKNIVEKYFHQKDFSTAEIIVLILAVASAIVAIFIQGGGPIGLACIACLHLCFQHYSFQKDKR